MPDLMQNKWFKSWKFGTNSNYIYRTQDWISTFYPSQNKGFRGNFYQLPKRMEMKARFRARLVRKTVWSCVVFCLAAQFLNSHFTALLCRGWTQNGDEVQGLDHVLQSCTTGTPLLHAVYMYYIFLPLLKPTLEQILVPRKKNR